MKEKPNPLAGIVDAMKAHDNRLAHIEPKPALAQNQPVVTLTKATTTPVQTVATVEQPRRVGEKVFCAARYTRGQIAKIDQIILLTHQERGVRISQSDILKKAIDRLPTAPLEEGEIAEILAASGRKQLNS
jgi:hypothetical protein